jgi:hypothetical protein
MFETKGPRSLAVQVIEDIALGVDELNIHRQPT